MVVPGWGALPGRARVLLSEVLVGTSQLWCTALSAECGVCRLFGPGWSYSFPPTAQYQ